MQKQKYMMQVAVKGVIWLKWGSYSGKSCREVILCNKLHIFLPYPARRGHFNFVTMSGKLQ